MNLIMTKSQDTVEKKTTEKVCMTYLKNITTKSFEIFKWQRAKLSQDEIDTMHEEIKVIYPTQWLWITKTLISWDCNCKK